MAISQYAITNAGWTAISTAGQKGSCWLEKVVGGSKGRCRIWHGESAPDASRLTHGFPLDWTEDNTDTALLVPDSANDVFYARADSADVSFILTVDVTI